MISRLSHVALLVRDQQEALDWYTQKLGFEVRSDEPFPNNPEARWVTVAPAGQTDLEVLLQPPEWGPEGEPGDRAGLVGKAPGFVLASTDCRRDYEDLKARGVEFTGPPMEMPWGVSVVFFDLYGYVHNLVETRSF
jgi:catechol 2,3-dioxygenase-like lactoylglutathione lyase family enzyme